MYFPSADFNLHRCQFILHGGRKELRPKTKETRVSDSHAAQESHLAGDEGGKG
jgi:hypothetical protein